VTVGVAALADRRPSVRSTEVTSTNVTQADDTHGEPLTRAVGASGALEPLGACRPGVGT
jgi:hypothetical protein